MLLSGAPDPAKVGDEPCLIAATGVAVAIGRDRPAAARLLIDAGCDLIVADDGLQHYRLARDLEICVIDGARRFGNERLLPAGPLREPMSRLQRVDLRVCNGGVAAGDEHLMQLCGGDIVSLSSGERQPLASLSGQRVHAVAAIGNPQRFFDSLRSKGIDVIEHAFADHHPFAVLMTDKDAVKCIGFAKLHWWRVPVHAELPDLFFWVLLDRIEHAKANRQTAA
jgi:tetraacyldisaccharide 4'-kinase